MTFLVFGVANSNKFSFGIRSALVFTDLYCFLPFKVNLKFGKVLNVWEKLE